MNLTNGAIDVNFSLGHWAFAPVGVPSAGEMLRQLDDHDIAQAWVGSLDGVFYRDLAGVNERLTTSCKESPDRLLPFGSVNPLAPDWREDLRRCHEVHRMPGIRLHPAYHGYRLDQPEFASLATEASQRKLIVQIVAAMEDERTQHPVFRVPPLDLAPLEKVIRSIPNWRVVLLNVFPGLSFEDAEKLASSGRVWFDIAMLEGVDRLAALVERVGPERIVLGSHWPFFHQQGALLKLRESALAASVIERIRRQNAVNLLAAR